MGDDCFEGSVGKRVLGSLLDGLTVRRCVGMQAGRSFPKGAMIPVGNGDWADRGGLCRDWGACRVKQAVTTYGKLLHQTTSEGRVRKGSDDRRIV